MPTKPYVDAAALATWMADTSGAHVPETSTAVLAALEWIDLYCERRFDQDGTEDEPAVRVFEATGYDVVDLGDVVSVAEVATDVDGDGEFETTWVGADWFLTPAQPETGWPHRRLHVAGSRRFPAPMTGVARRTHLVRVTGIFGWPKVPEAVKQACLIQGARLAKRSESPEGVLGGFGEMGAVRVGSKTDPDVAALLAPYRRWSMYAR